MIILIIENFEEQSINLLSDQSFLYAAQAIAAANETNLLELIFNLEAEIEKSICRDEISMNSKGREQEFYQELAETICYSI